MDLLLVYSLRKGLEVLADGLDYYHFCLNSDFPFAVWNLLCWKIELSAYYLIVLLDRVGYDQYLIQRSMKGSLGFDQIQHQKAHLLTVDQSFGNPQMDSNFLFELYIN